MEAEGVNQWRLVPDWEIGRELAPGGVSANGSQPIQTTLSSSFNYKTSSRRDSLNDKSLYIHTVCQLGNQENPKLGPSTVGEGGSLHS